MAKNETVSTLIIKRKLTASLILLFICWAIVFYAVISENLSGTDRKKATAQTTETLPKTGAPSRKK